MNHRNSQKRLQVDEGIFAIKVNTKDRYPFFQEEVFCRLFVEQLRLCKQVRTFRLYGFSLMPDHFHMMIHPGKGENISKVMHYLKKHISRNINVTMGYYEGEHIGRDGRQMSEDIHPRFQKNFIGPSEGEVGEPRHSNHSRPIPRLDHALFRKAFIQKHGCAFPHPKFS
ncbi:MAG: transposase [Candidatus Altimarinota bacterium]